MEEKNKKDPVSSEAEAEAEEESLSDEERSMSKASPTHDKVKEKRKKVSTPGKPKKPKIIVNVLNTEYDVVKEVIKRPFNYKSSIEPEAEWDLYWCDTGVTNEMLCRMKKYQKINHYPAMGCLARKNNLGKNLMRMRKEFPKEFGFFPPTWLLPYEWKEFKAQFNEKKCKTFIVKPEALSQGKGIFLTRTWENINPLEHYVVQRYVHKPYLIDGLKFDLRIYVLVYGCDPLRIYIYKEGLARLATDPYVVPTGLNLNNLFMHLTNYAINKNSENFVFNTDADKADVGHKRSLSFVWQYVDEHGGNSKELQDRIRDAIIKTLCSVQPQLADSYRSFQPNDDKNDKCFEILGFDILLDHKLKPWLLEVNHSPSFTTDTPFDVKIKSELLTDTIKILNLDIKRRLKYYRLKEIENNNRRLGKLKGVQVKKPTKEERAERKKKHMEKRDKYELANCGGYTRIYPDLNDPNKYEIYINTAWKIWEEFFGSKKKPKKEPEQPKLPPKLPPRKTLPPPPPKRTPSDITNSNRVQTGNKQKEGEKSVNGGIQEKNYERNESRKGNMLCRKSTNNTTTRIDPSSKMSYQSLSNDNVKYSNAQYISSIQPQQPAEPESGVYFPLISKLPAPFQKMKAKGIFQNLPWKKK